MTRVQPDEGDVLFRANNPLATGGWMGRDDLRGRLGNEDLYNHLGYQLGRQWIRQPWIGSPLKLVYPELELAQSVR